MAIIYYDWRRRSKDLDENPFIWEDRAIRLGGTSHVVSFG